MLREDLLQSKILYKWLEIKKGCVDKKKTKGKVLKTNKTK
jgi:hypothetical protein